MKYLLLPLLLCLATGLRADVLSTRLRLLLPGDDPATVNERQFLYQRIDQLFTRLEEEERLSRKSTSKQITRIVSRLQRELFRTFAADARLDDAFRTSRYSDATAAILTALAFERFQIDFNGYVDHWEAFLVADPEGKKVVVRSPSTKKRKETVVQAYQRDYLALIRGTVEPRLPSLTEEQAEALFYRYYYSPHRALSFGQLSAYLQYRRAQDAYQRKDYPACQVLLDAALAREERPAFLVLRRAAELQLAAANRSTVAGDVAEFFQQWAEDPTNRYLPAAILQHYDQQQRLFFAQNQVTAATALLEEYLERAPAGQAAWGVAIRKLHQLRLLNHYHTAGRLDLAKSIADTLYRQDPANPTVRYVLGELVIANLRGTRPGDPDFLRSAETAAANYPFIRQQDRFADLLLREQAWKVRDLYASDRPDLASIALEAFRKSLQDTPLGRERSLWTLTAFAAASNYHFRIEDYHGARHYVEEGLRHTPEDSYLLHRRAVLARY
ncbi:hypothetical protein QWY85_07815 [Neolewinella lacunae]|uniref:Uncharacterized protein n=1 Tax=Neolewinella lacunae TaxID=1517758 RepID=A0A923PL37_9BACT|nr:hypothetical protein [Neolewinella lacunae]MBC6994686.1 hypothetical protein [Neolewinella lacunae]MDN3634558.1 hypothetical protein [Neolewinella lacunae]